VQGVSGLADFGQLIALIAQRNVGGRVLTDSLIQLPFSRIGNHGCILFHDDVVSGYGVRSLLLVVLSAFFCIAQQYQRIRAADGSHRVANFVKRLHGGYGVVHNIADG
jgi:hypothetical protein